MDDIKRLYIELLFSAFNTGSFLKRTLSREIFEYYLEIAGQKKITTETLRDKYRGSTKEYFTNEIELEDHQKNFRIKKKALINSFNKIKNNKTEEVNFSNSEKEMLAPAYNFFCSKIRPTGKHPIELYRLNQKSLSKIGKMIEQIGRDTIELEILEEINDQLKFSDVYVPFNEKIKPKEEVNKVADACREIYMSNTDISLDDLLQTVLAAYHIKNYDDKSPKETERLTKKAVKQWARDHRDYGIK